MIYGEKYFQEREFCVVSRRWILVATNRGSEPFHLRAAGCGLTEQKEKISHARETGTAVVDSGHVMKS